MSYEDYLDAVDGYETPAVERARAMRRYTVTSWVAGHDTPVEEDVVAPDEDSALRAADTPRDCVGQSVALDEEEEDS